MNFHYVFALLLCLCAHTAHGMEENGSETPYRPLADSPQPASSLKTSKPTPKLSRTVVIIPSSFQGTPVPVERCTCKRTYVPLACGGLLGLCASGLTYYLVS